MKNSIKLFGIISMALVIIFSMAFIACEQPTDTSVTYTVTFNSNGGSAVPAQTVKHGEKVTEPTAITKASHALDGWYKEAALTNKWNFATDTVTADITLYAKWNINQSGDTVISIDAIEGVTAPVQGAAPVTAITANDQYTGTVTWNGTPATFAYDTVYTATITLTPKTGYTLQGVTEDFFTVAGADSVSNAANSGIVTAVFPQTEDDPSLLHLSGDVTISPNTDAKTHTPLTATYSGDEEVSFQWQKNGDDIGTASTTNPNTYTPTEEGSYTVIVSLEGYNTKSATVTVTTADLSGDLTISPNTGVTVGMSLVATYSGSEAVSFQWENKGDDIGTASTENPNTYTPNTIGHYSVTVRAAGYNPKTSDLVTVTLPTYNYTITGDGSSFTAQKDGVTITNGTGAIQDVINAIRTAAGGEPVSIQFVGTGESALDIGTASAQFTNDTGSEWGLITLSGIITSQNATTSQGTVLIGAGVSVNSTADIAVTSTGTNGRAIYKTGAGTVNITGGLVTATTGSAVYSFNDGVIIVSGSADIRSASASTSASAIYISGTGSPDKARLSILGGSVQNTSTGTSSYAVYNTSTSTGGPVEIKGGTVSATGSGYAFNNNSTGVVNISGGTISSTGITVYNASTGTVNISGGTVSATTSQAVYNNGAGTVNISGGEILVTAGQAVRNVSTGKITVSGDALITSANTGATEGTISIVNNGTDTAERLSITGGTVQNTSASTGNAISNASTGAVSVSGGTISAPLGFAVQNTNATAALTLSGTPIITGTLRAPAGKLGVTSFSPDSNKYYLDFASYAAGDIAVTGGADFGNNFTLFYQHALKLEANNGNLVIAANTNLETYSYTITASGSNFTAQKSGATIANGTGAIQDVINAIRTDAYGRQVSIQFGDGSDTLNIGTGSAQFNNVGGYWGIITFSGKIISANVTSTAGTVLIGANVSVVNSTADITNTAANSSARVLYIAGATGTNTQTVNIQSGTISATAANGRALYIAGTGTVNISNSTVSATTGYAVYNSSTGTVNISGGTVSATTGYAVFNSSTGTVNISGGTVSATTGQAVYNLNNGTITVSGSAFVTSANTVSASGTIYSGTGTTASLRIAITGGTVENTSTSTGTAVFNAGVGWVEISGGKISAQTYAVQCTTTSTTANAGAITLSGDPDITGRLRSASNGKLTVTSSFNPSTGRSYVLEFANEYYVAGNIAVIGGAASEGKFSLYSTAATPPWKLAVNGSDLVIAANP